MFAKYAKHDYHADSDTHPAPSVGDSPPPSPRTRPVPMSNDAAAALDRAKELDGESVMKCGRFRGHTFAAISRNAHYVKWVRGQKYPRGALAHLRQFLDRNAEWMLEEQMRGAQEATGTLSKRVRKWPLDEFRERGLLRPTPQVSNCTVGHTRRPRAPVYGLHQTGIVPEWSADMTAGDKWKVKCLTALVGRFLSYVFRRMLHEQRGEPIRERVIADHALLVLERNDYTYRLALQLSTPKNDLEGEVRLEALEAALQAKRATLVSKGKEKELSKLPTTLRPCFSRLGCAGQGVFHVPATETDNPKSTPRRILLRFMLSIGELQGALATYRDLHNYTWDDRQTLEAAWTMARADGAIDYDKITNEPFPDALGKVDDLPLYNYMQRVCARHFSLDVVPMGGVAYGPCVGFAATGCPLEADLRVGDTVYAIRSGLWIGVDWDFAYLQGYAALARHNGLELNRVSVIYLQHASVLEVELEDWDHTPLLRFLQAPVEEGKAEVEAEAEANACDLGLCNEPPPDIIEEEEKEREQQDKKKLRRKKALGRQALV